MAGRFYNSTVLFQAALLALSLSALSIAQVLTDSALTTMATANQQVSPQLLSMSLIEGTPPNLLAVNGIEDNAAAKFGTAVPGATTDAALDSNIPEVPAEFGYTTDGMQPIKLMHPWWQDASILPHESESISIELEEMIWLAISHSPHVQSVLLEPQILDAKATQQLGAFDPNRFVDSIFKDTSDPVGNTLITGGPPRINQSLWENRAGVRKRNQYGGQAELFQEMHFKDNNSRFFVPAHQANSRLVLEYNQPIRRGAGTAYNRSSFVIASVAATQGRFHAAQSLQDHAYRITEAYWELYTARASLAQITRGIDNLSKLRDRLEGRGQIDSVRSQLYRAEAALAKQQAALSSAKAKLIASDSTLRALVASPELRNTALPIVPTTATIDTPPQLDNTHERLAALEHQPRILEIQQEIKAARTKLQVAQNELQPTLNLVLQGYLAGLSGDNDLFRSVGDQFSGRPSYNAGVAYLRPKGNIAAQAIARESRMELRKSLLKLDEALLSVSANVDSAVAQVHAAYQALDSAVRATLSNKAEIEYLEAHWNDAFMNVDSRNNSLQLDQLLNAHIQLIAAENGWVQAERDYMLSLAKLDLATGSLLPSSPLMDNARE